MSPRISPLDAAHRALDAKMVPFGGWEMPLQYRDGTLAEHRACRSDAVVFDVSHLGSVHVTGADAFDRLQWALTNDLTKIEPGRAQYTHLLDEADASVLDDIIVWWIDPTSFMVMPNASNTDRVLEALGDGATDVTAQRAILALQGPNARERFSRIDPQAASIGRFRVGTFDWNGVPCTVAGTGYTGEDGVEVSVPCDAATEFWQSVLDAGFVPAGLGARDTLRLEAGLPLHGHELGPGITPLQAGLGWVVGWDKGPFRGRDALDTERRSGPTRHLVGLRSQQRRPPRAEQKVYVGETAVGAVTSGNFSPTLEVGIALAFVDQPLADGDVVTIGEANRAIDAEVTGIPFVAKH